MKESLFKIDPLKGKEFGLTIGIIIGLLTLYKLYMSHEVNLPLFLSAVTLIGLAFLLPQLLSPFAVLWLKFGQLLGKIINPIVLSLMYFLIITPYAFLLKLSGSKFLDLKINSKLASYWIEEKKELNQDIKSYFKKQY